MNDAEGAGRWIAIGSGVVTATLVLGVIGIYVLGLAQPAQHIVSATALLPVSPEAVWAVIGDPMVRPDWRPDVERIAQIDERDGKPVYRELDAGGDRFDFLILSSVPEEQVVLEVAAPEQIGFVGQWTWDLVAEAGGTRVTVTEDGTIHNPLWRGIYTVTRSPWDTVESELGLLGEHLGVEAFPERL